MVEVLLEPCGQDVAVPESGCNLNENMTECSPQDNRYHTNSEQLNLSPIQTFYNGQSIFVTGGTGFMGKLLIEKLLRECPGISFIYLLVRPKKGKDVHQRIEELFDDPVRISSYSPICPSDTISCFRYRAYTRTKSMHWLESQGEPYLNDRVSENSRTIRIHAISWCKKTWKSLLSLAFGIRSFVLEILTLLTVEY